MFLRFKLAKSRGLQCYDDKHVQIRIETINYLHPRTYEINREGDVICVHRTALDLMKHQMMAHVNTEHVTATHLFPGPRHAVVVVCLHLPNALRRAPPTCIH